MITLVLVLRRSIENRSISVLSIVFYCAGFLRVELELHEQKKRINALESVAEAKSPSNDTDMKIIKNAPGKFFGTS